jgi:flagellin-like hook-associated protein FlgL
VTIRWTHRRLRSELASAAGNEANTETLQSPLKQGVDAASAAAKIAHGVHTIETNRGLVSARASETAPRASLAQVVDSAAIEVKGLLGRMRQIAEQGAFNQLDAGQFDLLQQEFEMLQAEMARVATGPDLLDSCSDRNECKDFFEDLAPVSLSVDPSTARVDSKVESDWALFRIDAAEEVVDSMRDEFGTIEERVDAAIAELTEYVDSFLPSGRTVHTAAEALDVANEMRLELMQRDGVSPADQENHLQQSVTALLQ